MKKGSLHKLVLLLFYFVLLAHALAENGQEAVYEYTDSSKITSSKEQLTLQQIKSELIVEKWKIQGFCAKYLSVVFSDSLINIFFRILEFLTAIMLHLLYILLIVFRLAFAGWKMGICTTIAIIWFGVFAVRAYHLPKKYKSKTPSNKKSDQILNSSSLLSNVRLETSGLEDEDEDEERESFDSFSKKATLAKKSATGSDSDDYYNYNVKKLGPSVNFLDMFLKSIQIFGYLEEAVFYELTRQLQTQRVLAGERLSCIEETNDFCVIVDGLVNVYTANELVLPESTLRIRKSTIRERNLFDGYASSEEKSFDLSDDKKGCCKEDSESSSFSYGNVETSNKLLRKVRKGNILSSLLQLLNAFTELNSQDSSYLKPQRVVKKAGIMGIAVVDTTLAVIPEKAFRRVQKNFPKAAAQMIQVILSRMQRVTLVTMQSYLNVKDEVITFESNLSSRLPYRLNHSPKKRNQNSYYFDTFSQLFKHTLENIKQLCAHGIKESTEHFKLYDDAISRSRSNYLKAKSSDSKTRPSKNHLRKDIASEEFNGSGFYEQNAGHRVLLELLNGKDIIKLDETIIEELGHICGGNILKKKIEEIKEQSESDFFKSSGISQLERVDFEMSTPSGLVDGEKDNFWPVPRISDFLQLKKEATKVMSDVLGFGSNNELKSLKNRKGIYNHHKLGSVYSNISSVHLSGSEAGEDYNDPANLKPLRIFPKIEYHQSLANTKKCSTNPAPSFLENKIQTALSEIEILYVSPGKKIIKKGRHVQGIFLVLSGAVEISENGNEPLDRNDEKKHEPDENGFKSAAQSDTKVIERSKSMTRIAYQIQNLLEPYKDFDSIDCPKALANKINPNKEYFKNGTKKISQTKRKSESHVLSDGESLAHESCYSDESSPKTDLKATIAFPGEIVGHLSAIIGTPSNITVQVATTELHSTDLSIGAILAFLPLSSIENHLAKVPQLYSELAKSVSKSITPLIYHVDYSLDLKRLSGGKIIYRAGNNSDNVHLVLAGRLRALIDKSVFGETGYSIKEYGHGESIGEADVLGGEKRSFSLYTIRDSEFILIPKTLFSILVSAYPKLTFHISKLIASHILNHFYGKRPSAQRYMPLSPNKSQPLGNLKLQNQYYDSSKLALHDVSHYNSNLKTVCILPVNDYVPVKEFSSKLYEALVESFGYNFVYLDSAQVLKSVGKNAFNHKGKLKMDSYLAGLEEEYRLLLYVADSGLNSKWTHRCIRQADCILIVGLGDEDSSVGPYEQIILESKSTARKELVLLHAERTCIPGSTREWLSKRKWVYTHHHIQMPLLVRDPEKRSKQTNSIGSNDISILTFMIGLVAKLFTLLGLYEPNEAVGSKKPKKNNYNNTGVGTTSAEKTKTPLKLGLEGTFDSFVGQSFGSNYDLSKATNEAILKLKMRLKSYYSKFINKGRDYNPSPYKGYRSDFSRLGRRLCNKSVGLVMGGGGARGLAFLGVLRAFEEAGIPVDMVGGTSIGAFFSGLYAQESDSVAIWRRAKLFANHMQSFWRTVLDLTWPILSYTSGNEFNRALWKIFKDVEIEDLWLPFYCVTTNVTHSKVDVHTSGYLWKYCRASMSLSGFLPPLCDNDGQMLVDGGYLDNLPVKYMYNELGANMIFAIDIAGETDSTPVHYGEAVSGLNVILNNINPFRKFTIPNLSDIQSRLAYASSVQTLRDVKAIPGVIYAKIPPKDTGVLDFSKFNSTYKKGYYYASTWVEAWRNENKLDLWTLPYKKMFDEHSTNIQNSKKSWNASRNATQHYSYKKPKKYFDYYSDSTTGYVNRQQLQRSLVKPRPLRTPSIGGNKKGTIRPNIKYSNKDKEELTTVHFYAFSD